VLAARKPTVKNVAMPLMVNKIIFAAPILWIIYHL
jgi:hypothetical protein